MINYQLVKFTYKYEARQILRQLDKSINHSSIYSIGKQQYLLVQESNYTTISIQAHKIDSQTVAEELLYQWAKSEIEDSLSFIRYESESKYIANGRSLVATNEEIVVRSFDYLSDVFGIVNCTSDSFSDGGKYHSLDQARERVISLVDSGCSVIDIGVESTRPNARSLTGASELQILQAYLPMLMELKQQLTFQLSIDTYHPETIQYLIEQDIDFINDVSGDLDKDVVLNLIKAGKKYIAMHSLDVPAKKNNVLDFTLDPIAYLSNWALAKMGEFAKYGINQKQIILDPGIGFGNNSAQAWYIIRNLDKFNSCGAEVLLGHSRKSLFNHISDMPASKRDQMTAILAAIMTHKVDYLRLHDIEVLNQIYPVINQLHQVIN